MKISHNHPNPFNAQSGIPVNIPAAKPERLEVKVKESIGDFLILEDGRLKYRGLFIEKDERDITMSNDIYYGGTRLPEYMNKIPLKDLVKDSRFRSEIKSTYNYVTES